MIYTVIIVTSMALFATAVATAFAWAVVSGQFKNSAEAAASIFWDEDSETHDGQL